ncbi:hypothetical protein [Lysobacter gummosus]|uniref:hypothetical protein n=1 Tax=Lysobacter gummosus TaxID=262324 RepID=UPI00362EFA36
MPTQAGPTLGILPKVGPGARPCAPPFGCPSVSRVTSDAPQQQKNTGGSTSNCNNTNTNTNNCNCNCNNISYCNCNCKINSGSRS